MSNGWKYFSYAITAVMIIWLAWDFLNAPVQFLFWAIFLCTIIFPLAWFLQLSFKHIANEEAAYGSAVNTSVLSLIFFAITFIVLAFLTMGIANASFGEGTSKKMGTAGLIPIIFISSAFTFWVLIGTRLSPVTRNSPLGLFSKHALFISLIMAVLQLLFISLAIWITREMFSK